MILIALYVLWAVACVVVYGANYRRARIERAVYRDRRSDHELYVASGFLIASIAMLAGVALAILQAGTLYRLGFSALALGAFLGAGIVMYLELPRQRK